MITTEALQCSRCLLSKSFVVNPQGNLASPITHKHKQMLQYRFNLLTPNVNYGGRTDQLNSKVAFYIFIQQI